MSILLDMNMFIPSENRRISWEEIEGRPLYLNHFYFSCNVTDPEHYEDYTEHFYSFVSVDEPVTDPAIAVELHNYDYPFHEVIGIPQYLDSEPTSGKYMKRVVIPDIGVFTLDRGETND